MPPLEAALPAARGTAPSTFDRIRAAGLWPTLRKAFADHVLRYSSSVIVEYDARRGHSLGEARVHPDWLSFAIVRDATDLPLLSDWLAWRRDGFAGMLADGKVGIFALDQGVAVSCMWLSLSDHRDIESREFYPVAPREAYHYCWLTDPTSRRRNVTLPLCRYFLSHMAEIGIDRAFGVVDRVNRASYLLQLHFGYRERGVKVIHIVLFGQRFSFTSRYDGILGTTDPKDRKMPRG